MHGTKNGYVNRCVILVGVSLLHVAIVLMLLKFAVGRPATPAPEAVQVLVFPPEPKPKIKPDNARPRSARGEMALSIVPPELPAVGNAPTAAGAGEHGSGVDWNAEARRAVHAFDIRKQGAANNEPNPGKLAADGWWPRAHHHAGEQYKTDTGDWIVWIDSECYQIANSAPRLGEMSALLPRTICPGKPAEARGTE